MATSTTVEVIEIDTQPYQDQKPGTSGLRKKVTHFQQPNYLQNFIQSTYEVIKPTSVVLGGDGRYWSEEAMKTIITVLVANGVTKIIAGCGGILSTPAASALIRRVEASMGIILTASHNPGGPDADFGVKINSNFGQPAQEDITDQIYEYSKTIKTYKSFMKAIKYPISSVTVIEVNQCKIAFVNPTSNYTELLQSCFCFPRLVLNDACDAKLNRNFTTLNKMPFKMLVDCMNGVTGPYVKDILVKELNVKPEMIMNADPLPDFGGKHPDPNLTYAKELVDRMKADPEIDLGVAFDGDGDRNMILGSGGFFVSPGDSLAIIAKLVYDNPCISQFKGNNVKGFARSFPTSPAVDRVCKEKGYRCYETPTGWKYFFTLLHRNYVNICGEESFGTGADHIREKDGLWTCLMWMSIIHEEKKSVKEIVEDHWKEYGRDYFNRYDYEDCDATKCKVMMNELETLLTGKSLIGKKYGSKEQYEVSETGNFEYQPPLSTKKVEKQGLFVKFQDSSRIIIRLSGTGSSGATVRLYLNAYSKEDVLRSNEDFLKELLEISYEITKLRKHTGRDKPDVIT